MPDLFQLALDLARASASILELLQERQHHTKEIFPIMPATVIEFNDNQYQPITFVSNPDKAGVSIPIPSDLVGTVTDNPQDFSVTSDPNVAAGQPPVLYLARTGRTNADPTDGSEIATVSFSSPSNPSLQIPDLVFKAIAAPGSITAIAGTPENLPEPGAAAKITIAGISSTAGVGSASQQGTAVVTDANDIALNPQPAVNWTGNLQSGGSLSDTGLYTPGPTAGDDTITATDATDSTITQSVTVTVS